MRIKAFQGLRPRPEVVAEVASLPYDVVSTEEARALTKNNPRSFLHVVRAEVDLPEGTDLYSDAVYEKAQENFKKLQDDGDLVRESEPSLYLYELEWKGHVQRGITTTCHIEDYESEIIKKHENTRPAKENDRLRLNQALSAHPGPIFLTYRDNEIIDEIVNDIAEGETLFNFTAEDGVRHTVWKITGDNAFGLISLFEDVPCAYVADGHHRAASAARMGREHRDNNPGHTGDEPYNWFLAVLFPASQLKVLPYNRVVKDLNGYEPDKLLIDIRETCTVYENLAPEPEKHGQICMYIKEQWLGLSRNNISKDPITSLDVSFLQTNVLGPLLGIADPRTDQRIDFIGGIRGIKELEKLVDSGEFEIAFSMYPVSIDQLLAIADKKQIMPPKSTWFEPKLRSGLFVHTV